MLGQRPAVTATVRAAAPAPRPRFTERARPGIQFSETLCGSFVWTDGPDRLRRPEDGLEPWTLPETLADPQAIVFDVSILADDIERFVSHCDHEARLVGRVTAPGLSETPMAIRNGRFNLFVVDPERVETRYMRYAMTVTSADGDVYRIEGVKVIRRGSWRALWGALTTVYVTLWQLRTGRRGRGTLRRPTRDFLSRLAFLKPTNTRGFTEQLDVRARLIGFFATVARSMYGGILAHAIVATVDAPPRPRRAMPVPAEPFEVPTSDTTWIHLTRYRGGERGPVMLAPGFSVSASSFAADTVDENLVERLLRERYDVWLLDYRSSSSFPSAATSFSIDDIALRDYPAAVARVRRETGAEKIQIVAHCIGSLTLLTAILCGKLDGQLRSVICSQLGLHPIPPRAAEIKASLRVASLLRRLGVLTLSADFNPYDPWHRLADKLLTLYPTDQRCNNPVCRRILLLLGESFRHEQLNTATHDTIADWFGTASVPALAHLSLMLRAGKVVDRDGRDVYLSRAEGFEHLKIPITFIHGTLNREFLPRSTRTTYRMLCRLNGPNLYRRILLRGYGHMDCFIGKHAAGIVFDQIVDELRDAPERALL